MSRPGPRPQRRFPIGPLEAWIAPAPSATATDAELASGRASIAVCARAIGVHPSQVARWRSDGLTLHAADRAAVALGLHPLNVWPDFHDDLGAAS